MRLLLCCLVVLLCSAVVGGVTVTPTATSLYLNNPLSGLYKWYDSMEAPLPTRDTYYRWTWREIETSQGVYDYSKIDAKLAEAKDVFNGKFGFRIIISDTFLQGKSVPDYFATTANGWTCTALGNTWIPNWNGAALLTRVTALFDALATRYANDSRLGFLDVGIYGNYGEWHNAEFYDAGCFPGPNGWGEATYATKQSFINLVTSRFPNKYIVLNTNDYEGSCIALSGTRLGLRGDTFSDAGWTSSVGTNDQLFELYRLQYRSAPFISEFSTGPDFTKALANALEDHRTNVGNGNFPTWDYQSTAQKNALLAAAPFIGPRLRLTSATYTSPIPPYGCLQLSLTFVNDGSSRVYDPYNLIIQFRSTTTGAVVWQTPSSVADIRNVLPSNDGVASWTGTNNFQLPCTIATGTYNVVLLLQDPTNYRPNFLLAIANVNGDGSYTLGQVTISTSATYNPSCTTTIPSYTQPKYPIGPGVNSWNDHPLGPIYTDFLMWGWQQELNGATGNVANTSPVYGSSGKSIAFTTTNAYGIWGAVHVCSVDRTGYTYIHFRMRAATAGAGTVFFYPYQSPWNSPPSVELTNYGGNPTNTGWTNYNIPFSAFAGLPTKFDHLVFGAYNNGVTFYIDDISFSDTAITP